MHEYELVEVFLQEVRTELTTVTVIDAVKRGSWPFFDAEVAGAGDVNYYAHSILVGDAG